MQVITKGRISRLLLCILLSLAVIITMTPLLGMPVHAESTAGTAGTYNYVIPEGVTPPETTSATPVTPIEAQTSLNAGWYIVSADKTIADRITVNGAVNIILCDDKTLTASQGITVTGDNNSLTVWGQINGTGKLVATGEINAAGIGGGQEEAGSNITINGGTVNATGGPNGAGIGGGDGGTGSNITINGGTVTATCNSGGAGIGGGQGEDGSDITISGGTVTATCNSGGAGIGGGSCGDGSDITISGGTVTATGGEDAAGIGIGNVGTTATNIKASANLVVQKSSDNANWETVNHASDTELAGNLARYVKVGPAVAEITSGGTTTKYASVQAAINAATEGETVKMISDFDLDATIVVKTGKTATIDLNGHVLNAGKIAEPKSPQLFETANVFANYGTLTIKDSDPENAHTDWNTSHPVDKGNADLSSITGGVLTGGKGGFNRISSETDENVVAPAVGGAIYNYGNLTITGGTITGNSSGEGSGIAIIDGSLNLTDVTITGNKVAKQGSNFIGGGISAYGSEITVGGKTVVSGNKTTDGAENNVYLYEGQTLKVGTGDNELKAGASIGVTTKTSPTAGNPVAVTGDNGNKDYSAYFTSDNDNYIVINDEETGTTTIAKVKLAKPAAEITTAGGATTKYRTMQEAIKAAQSGDTIKLLADSSEDSVTVNTGVTLNADGHSIKTTNGWTLNKDSITAINSLKNGDDVTAMNKTGIINGSIYAPEGTLDLRGVDLRVKSASSESTDPVIKGGTADSPAKLTELKATRAFFGDIYDGSGNQIISKITLENCTTAYRAALGVYYDSLTVDDVKVNADSDDWYWNQQYQDYNYQMYTGYGGTLNINNSLTTGEYMNAGYSVGGTGITNLAEGAVLNCLDFQNTGNSQSGVTEEQAKQNITDGKVNVNGPKATLNAAALNNHAITTFGTVNLTAHPTHSTKTGGLTNVNYGTDAVLKIGTLNFLNKEGDTTKSLMRAGDNAKAEIGALTTSSVGADFYVTGTSETTVNKDGGNKVEYIGDIIFNKYSDSDSNSNASFTMNLDSSDDSFTGSVKGTTSESKRWGKWGWPANDDATVDAASVKNMTLNMSNGSKWNLKDDSVVNTLNVSNSTVSGEYDLTVGSSAALDASGKIEVADFTNNGTITIDMTGATASSIKLIDCSGTGSYGTEGTNYKFAEGKDNGYTLKIEENDLYAVKSVSPTPTPTPDPQPDPQTEIVVPVSGDEGNVQVKATVDENNAKIETITKETLENVGTGENVTIDLSEVESQGKTLEISEVTLTKETVENIKESPVTGLQINLSTATVIIDQDTLSAVAEQASGDEIKLVVNKDEKAEETLTESQKQTIGHMNEPEVLDAYFISNGKRITDFKGGTVKILVEYPTDKPVRVWFVPDNGDKENVKSEFDKEKQIATFEAEHFSHYVIETIIEAKDGLIATGSAKKTTNTIKWNAVDDADGYDVYYAKCGNNLKKVKSTTALKYTKKGLNKKKYYKYRVKVYETVDGNKVYLATSPVIHIAGVSTKYSNATKVTADPDGMNIEAGDTDVIKAKITKKSNKKTVLWKNHVSAKIRYMSTDSSVVTVDSKGNVTAIGAGEAYVYAYAASGAFAKITVTVQ